jgi:hypothetical protein
MDIGPLTPRDGSGGSRCPYCHDDIVQGPACDACGARYHQECAQTFGACAVQACRGEVALPTTAAPEVLPRLGALSRRIGRWTPPPGGPRALVLDLPASKAVRDDPKKAGRVVGEIIGQTPYDGRMRVLSPFPEVLVRVRSEAEAERMRDRLAAAGLRSIAPPLDELVRPFAPFKVAKMESDGFKLELESPEGERRTLWHNEPRLVVSSGIVSMTQVTGRLMKGTRHYGRGGRTSKRAAGTPAPRKQRERCAYVFVPGVARPSLFLLSDLARGGHAATTHSNFHGLLEELSPPGADRLNLPEVMCSSQVFMHPVDELGKTRSNAAFVALLARLTFMCWVPSDPGGKK